MQMQFQGQLQFLFQQMMGLLTNALRYYEDVLTHMKSNPIF